MFEHSKTPTIWLFATCVLNVMCQIPGTALIPNQLSLPQKLLGDSVRLSLPEKSTSGSVDGVTDVVQTVTNELGKTLPTLEESKDLPIDREATPVEKTDESEDVSPDEKKAAEQTDGDEMTDTSTVSTATQSTTTAVTTTTQATSTTSDIPSTTISTSTVPTTTSVPTTAPTTVVPATTPATAAPTTPASATLAPATPAPPAPATAAPLTAAPVTLAPATAAPAVTAATFPTAAPLPPVQSLEELLNVPGVGKMTDILPALAQGADILSQFGGLSELFRSSGTFVPGLTEAMRSSGALGAVDALNSPIMRMVNTPKDVGPYPSDIEQLMNALPSVVKSVPDSSKVDFSKINPMLLEHVLNGGTIPGVPNSTIQAMIAAQGERMGVLAQRALDGDQTAAAALPKINELPKSLIQRVVEGKSMPGINETMGRTIMKYYLKSAEFQGSDGAARVPSDMANTMDIMKKTSSMVNQASQKGQIDLGLSTEDLLQRLPPKFDISRLPSRIIEQVAKGDPVDLMLLPRDLLDQFVDFNPDLAAPINNALREAAEATAKAVNTATINHQFRSHDGDADVAKAMGEEKKGDADSSTSTFVYTGPEFDAYDVAVGSAPVGIIDDRTNISYSAAVAIIIALVIGGLTTGTFAAFYCHRRYTSRKADALLKHSVQSSPVSVVSSVSGFDNVTLEKTTAVPNFTAPSYMLPRWEQHKPPTSQQQAHASALSDNLYCTVIQTPSPVGAGNRVPVMRTPSGRLMMDGGRVKHADSSHRYDQVKHSTPLPQAQQLNNRNPIVVSITKPTPEQGGRGRRTLH